MTNKRSCGVLNFCGIVSVLFIHLIGFSRAAPETLFCTIETGYIPPCGAPIIMPIFSRVVGGTEAIPGSWPWMVMLVENGYHSCGGSIIDEYFILTAAHCFDGASLDTNRWLVVAGRHRFDRPTDHQLIMRVSRIIIHEKYNSTSIENDVAVLVLAEPLTYNTYIRPVCLPQASQGVTTGQICVLAGWGTTQGTGDNRALNQVTLPVIADSTCSQPDWYGDNFQPETTFCAGYAEGGKDACSGDSGSPLVCFVNGAWYAQGISSWGSGCAQKKWPGVYTDVSKFIHWIKLKVESEEVCTILG